jgi:large subunit ribosomal protein L1
MGGKLAMSAWARHLHLARLPALLLPVRLTPRLHQTVSSASVDASVERDQPIKNALPQPKNKTPVAASSSRVYVLGRRKEQEIDITVALRALRAYSLTRSAETVVLDINVDMRIKKDKIRDPFRGPVVLPHTFGQKKIILFVSESEHHNAALEAGADIVRSEDVFLELEADSLNFDICLTTPTLLDRFKPLQRTLKSKMPNIRRGTVVTEDSVAEAVQQFKTSREFRSDRSGLIHVPVGKLDFPDDHIVENISSVLASVVSHRGNRPKSSFLKTVILTSTYGPGFSIQTRALL